MAELGLNHEFPFTTSCSSNIIITLLSVDTQPDHCISWAKALFDETFSNRLRSLRIVVSAAGSGKEALTEAIENLSQDEVAVVLLELRYALPTTVTPAAALRWARHLFQREFSDAVRSLLHANPPDKEEEDEDGAKRPFWGGSRRVPVPAVFDAQSALHRSFVTYAAFVWGRSRGQHSEQWSVQALDGLLQQLPLESEVMSSVSPEGLQQAVQATGAGVGEELLASLSPQEFEKVSLLQDSQSVSRILPHCHHYIVVLLSQDVAEYGHVDFVTAAANIRYGLRSLTERLRTFV